MQLLARTWPIVISIALLACSKAPEEPKAPPVVKSAPQPVETVPSEPLAFREHLIKRMPEALSRINCTCCNKPLLQCFNETITSQAGACDYG